MLSDDKQLRDFAKKLVQLSLDTEGLPSAERVEAVLEALKQKPPRQPKATLQLYLHYIKREVRKTGAVVEAASGLSETALDGIAVSLTQQLGRKILASQKLNADLLGGVRVRIGDDVYDNSVAGRLAALEANVR